MKRLNRMFPQKYRVISYDTGPGTDFLYRSVWTAAYWAMYYEYTEFRAGIQSKGWGVQQKAGT